MRGNEGGAWNIPISALLKEKKDRTLVQLARYTVTGGAAFAVDFSLLFVFTEHLGVYYLLSAVLSFSIALAVNYLLSTRWVFKRRSMQNRYYEFGVFAAISAAGLGLNALFIWFFTELISFHYLFSKIMATMIVYLWNFFTKKLVLFR